MVHPRPRRTRRIRHIRLVPVTDEGYRAYMEDLRARNYTLRDKRPPTASQLVGYMAEKTVRMWLERNTLLTDRRVLAYQVQEGDYGYRDMYRELDAVAVGSPADPGAEETPTCVYEIKCSRRPTVVWEASRQLGYTLDLLRKKWSSVQGCVIYVDFSGGLWRWAFDGAPLPEDLVVPPGPRGQRMSWWQIDPDLVTDAAPAAAAVKTPRPGDDTPPADARHASREDIWFSIVDREWVRGLAADYGLLDDPDLWTRAEAEAGEAPDDEEPQEEEQSRTLTYYAGDTDAEAESPLALALKKAGLGGKDT